MLGSSGVFATVTYISKEISGVRIYHYPDVVKASIHTSPY